MPLLQILRIGLSSTIDSVSSGFNTSATADSDYARSEDGDAVFRRVAEFGAGRSTKCSPKDAERTRFHTCKESISHHCAVGLIVTKYDKNMRIETELSFLAVHGSCEVSLSSTAEKNTNWQCSSIAAQAKC